MYILWKIIGTRRQAASVEKAKLDNLGPVSPDLIAPDFPVGSADLIQGSGFHVFAQALLPLVI